MKIKRLAKRFIKRPIFWINVVLFCLSATSLTIALCLPDSSSNLAFLLILIFFFPPAAILILEWAFRLKKLFFYIFMAAQIVIGVWFSLFINVLADIKNDIIGNILCFFIISYYLIAFFILYFFFKFIFLLLKKYHFGQKLKKNCKSIYISLGIIVLLLFSWNYITMNKRINRLERIAGTKKILCDEKKSIEKVKKSLVRIVGTNGEGSGFFVSPTGLIVTNHHVIADSTSPKIIFPDYSFTQGEVVMADANADLAFIKIYGKENLPVLSYADSDKIEYMEEIISLGYPLGTSLRGDPTAIKGRFVALRPDKQTGMKFVQTDLSLNHGASGGPMINLCGEVVAINAIGTAGLGMGISANDFKDKWSQMAGDKEPVKEVKKIEFNPDKSPKDCVEAFYNYQTVGKLKEAYDLLTRNYTQESFEKWQEGYKNTFNILLYETKELEDNKVFVKFSSADLIEEEIVYRFFEGEMEVVKENNHYKINKHEIKEIIEPGWDWFYSMEE